MFSKNVILFLTSVFYWSNLPLHDTTFLKNEQKFTKVCYNSGLKVRILQNTKKIKIFLQNFKSFDLGMCKDNFYHW